DLSIRLQFPTAIECSTESERECASALFLRPPRSRASPRVCPPCEGARTGGGGGLCSLLLSMLSDPRASRGLAGSKVLPYPPRLPQPPDGSSQPPCSPAAAAWTRVPPPPPPRRGRPRPDTLSPAR
ncbi:hypothetical protein KUCAC02_002165, partial [Chaenocephalus aceratus]